MKLSVAMATFNEESNIGKCLESVKDLADEVIIVDGSSTDKTREIARTFGATVIKTANKPMFHLLKNMAINDCRGDWILQLDADEMIGQELGSEIKSIISSPLEKSADAYWIKRRNYFLGRYLKKGGQYPDPVIRLFKRGKAILPAKSVHEQMKVDGKVGWLKNDLDHWATPTLTRYWLRENRYATLEAANMLSKKVSINLLTTLIYIIVVPLKTFFLIYFRHKGFLDSWQGFLFALFSGFHFAWAYWKYFKMTVNNNFEVGNSWK